MLQQNCALFKSLFPRSNIKNKIRFTSFIFVTRLRCGPSVAVRSNFMFWTRALLDVSTSPSKKLGDKKKKRHELKIGPRLRGLNKLHVHVGVGAGTERGGTGGSGGRLFPIDFFSISLTLSPPARAPAKIRKIKNRPSSKTSVFFLPRNSRKWKENGSNDNFRTAKWESEFNN